MQHPRSKKPDIKKVNQDEGKQLTQEELDYQKYVEADPSITASTLINSTRVQHHNQTAKPPKPEK